jgi:hypothetical protein
MEYYDSHDNSLLYSHYNNKNINLLLHPDVAKVLDKFDLRRTSDLKGIQALMENPYKVIHAKKEDIVIPKIETIDTSRVLNNLP